MKKLIIFVLICLTIGCCKDWTEEILDCDLLNWDYEIEYINNSNFSIAAFNNNTQHEFLETRLKTCIAGPANDQVDIQPGDSFKRLYRGSASRLTYFESPGHVGIDYEVHVFNKSNPTDGSVLKFRVTINDDLSATLSDLNN